MKIKTTIKYYESYIPYRCRKPRYEEQTEVVEINLRETNFENLKLKYESKDWKIYEYKGKLYKQATLRNICSGDFNENYQTILQALQWWNLNGSCYYAMHKEYNCIDFWSYENYETKDDILKRAKKDMLEYLLVDGVMYVRTYKPYYDITTFGLGNNHGGTGIFLNDNKRFDKKKYEWLFEVEDFDNAWNYFVKVALSRGDTESVNNRDKEYYKVKIYE